MSNANPEKSPHNQPDTKGVGEFGPKIVRFAEILEGMREQSTTVVLDFNEIDEGLPEYANIKAFFESSLLNNIDPKLPENRQRFNDTFLHAANKKYLIGRYGEDRIEMLRGSKIAAEGRTIHLGVDLFTENVEPLFAPYEGIVVAADYEPGAREFGHYCIVEHKIQGETLYTFYGHLSSTLPSIGLQLKAGQQFARLGDYEDDENGGWSRHVHFQLLRQLPPTGQTPIGYSTRENFPLNSELFPDPSIILQLR